MDGFMKAALILGGLTALGCVAFSRGLVEIGEDRDNTFGYGLLVVTAIAVVVTIAVHLV